MKSWPRHLVGVVAAAGVMLAVLASAGAETCTLELKRLEPPGQSGSVVRGSTSDYIYRATSSQNFFVQMGLGQPAGGAKEFAAIVKKEPDKYQSEHPFRGVAKLGSGQYPFVLDAKDEKSIGYSRLYFDLNRNGDLTDDEAIDAIDPSESARRTLLPTSYARHRFPRVDLTIDVDGAKVDYAFFFSVYSGTATVRRNTVGKEPQTETIRYASASLNAAAYRQGEITLDGKSRRVVLIDFNSNGRFDDEFKIRKGVRTSGGSLVTDRGDRLLVDPDPSQTGYRSPYDVTSSGDQHDVSNLVDIDGRFYDLEVSTSGEKLTLTPSSVPLGHVTNPNEGFRAVVYSEKGFLKISGAKSKPIPLPEGDWKLLSYTIDRTGYEKPDDQAADKEKKEQAGSLLQAVVSAVVGGATPNAGSISRPRYTLVSARATGDYKPLKVRQGQTIAMPFGSPFKPIVKASFSTKDGEQTASLAMSLVGSGGEVCSSLMVDGQRPGKPEFTISTPDGKEVASGSFEYG